MKIKTEAIVREADVLVVGGGLAGCFAAIKAKEFGGRRVIQICKGRVGKSGQSAFAAGTMCAFNPEEDDFNWALKEVVEGADYLVDQHRIRDHLNEVWGLVQEMEGFGAGFEKTKDGKLQRYLGRGNIKNVMFHGPQLMEAVAKKTLHDGVEQFNKIMMTDLLTDNGRVVGAVAIDVMNGDFYVFKAKATVLATGPSKYKAKSNGHRDCTGDGFVAAYEIGCDITGADISAYNLRPTYYDIGPGMVMLQGSGLILLNAKGERFMEKYEPNLKERSLLSVVVACCAIEVKRGNGPIYADMTHFTPEQVERLKRVIPLPMRVYERVGIVIGDRFIKKFEMIPAGPMPIWDH